jgi:hypothetical protein
MFNQSFISTVWRIFMKKEVMCIGLGLILLVLSAVEFSYAGDVKQSKNETYLAFNADIYLPQHQVKDKKLPVVLLVHNGGANKEGWGDYPEQLAAEGWLVMAFTWDVFKTTLEIESAIKFLFIEYKDRIDPEKAAIVAGCRGAANSLALLAKLKKLPCRILTVVALSVSESVYPEMFSAIQAEHPPVLAYYSLKDRLGEKYQAVSKQFAEEQLTQPKTVIALDATPHGHEMVTDPDTKDKVRKEILEWLKRVL